MQPIVYKSMKSITTLVLLIRFPWWLSCMQEHFVTIPLWWTPIGLAIRSLNIQNWQCTRSKINLWETRGKKHTQRTTNFKKKNETASCVWFGCLQHFWTTFLYYGTQFFNNRQKCVGFANLTLSLSKSVFTICHTLLWILFLRIRIRILFTPCWLILNFQHLLHEPCVVIVMVSWVNVKELNTCTCMTNSFFKWEFK